MKGLANTFQPQFPFKGIVAAMAQMGFNPRTLFAANEPGVWYDPSDLSTLFQDSAGTTPVTAVGQPVGLMLDKSKGLTLGALTAAIKYNNATPGKATYTNNPDGSTTCTANLDAIGGYAYNGFSLEVEAGKTYLVRTFSYEPTLRIYYAHTAGQIDFVQVLGSGGVQLSGEHVARLTIPSGKNHLLCVTQQVYPFVGSFTTAPSQVRELPGNHAYQTTATSRPVLSARYNLLTKTEQFDDAVWPKDAASVTPDIVAAPDGSLTADKLVASATNANHLLNRTGAFKTVSGALYTYTMFAKAAEYSWIRLQVQVTAFPETWANFNVATGAVGLTTGNVQAIITAEANGWYRCSITAMANASDNSGVQPFVLDSNRGTANPSYTGDGTSGIYIWGADLRVANDGANLPPYQRVNTATDYDTQGFPHYLRFDGVDDWLVTPTITPGIDKVQVFAGVRKLSDAATGIVCELSQDSNVNPGSLYLLAPSSAAPSYGFRARGTVIPTSLAGTLASPVSLVLTGVAQIASPLQVLRANGVQIAQSTADQGTGNYLAYPLYIGCRGGTTFPFNGRLYSLIVRFGSNLPAATIEKTEKYINTKTRAY